MLPKSFHEGLSLHKKGKPLEAKAKYDIALNEQPNNADIHNALGVLGFQNSNFEMAKVYFKNCVILQPKQPSHWNNLINACLKADDLEFAICTFNELLDQSQDNYELLATVAGLYERTHQHDEALQAYQTLHAHNKASLKFATSLAFSYHKNNQPDKADEIFRYIIENLDNPVSGKGNYAVFLMDTGRIDETIRLLQEIHKDNPTDIKTLFNLANAYRLNEQYDKALTTYKNIISIEPDHADAHAHSAFCHLVKGNLKTGWEEYEWRWKSSTFPNEIPDLPKWDGNTIKKKHIVLYSEQGLGDTLQFCRYASVLKENKAEVSIIAPASLHSILSSMNIFKEISVDIEGISSADFIIPTMSLPGLLGINQFSDIKEEPPYLKPLQKISTALQVQLDSNTMPKIGICWKGSNHHLNDRFRSIPFHEFSKLFKIPDIQFVSLQMDRDKDKEVLPPSVIDVVPYIHDFSDTAAIANHLDLIISVDTSVVHLCGACGFPVWLLINKANDWRWFTEQSDTPWYNHVEIIRNSSLNDWGKTIFELRKKIVTNFCNTAHNQ